MCTTVQPDFDYTQISIDIYGHISYTAIYR